MKKLYYENRWVVLLIQIATIFFIVISKLDLILQLMFIFAYFMLFRQKRWHKHLLIMLLMTMIISYSNGGLQFTL